MDQTQAQLDANENVFIAMPRCRTSWMHSTKRHSDLKPWSLASALCRRRSLNGVHAMTKYVFALVANWAVRRSPRNRWVASSTPPLVRQEAAQRNTTTLTTDIHDKGIYMKLSPAEDRPREVEIFDH